MTEPRHSTFDADPVRAALQAGENARDTLEALAERPRMRRVTVERYTATGSTSSKIRVGSGARPWAIILALAAPAYALSSPVAAAGMPGFAWDATTQSIDVFEPSGLVANTVYRLQFLVVEE